MEELRTLFAKFLIEHSGMEWDDPSVSGRMCREAAYRGADKLIETVHQHGFRFADRTDLVS